MALFIVTFFVMALAVLGMAIGIVFGRTPIAGSCGGLNAINGSGECRSCSRPCKAREQAMLANSEQTPVKPQAQVLHELDRHSGNL